MLVPLGVLASSGSRSIATDYLVIAGAGAGGTYYGGGGGAGGYRTGTLTVSGLCTVTIGAGGSGSTVQDSITSGTNSVFASITSTGGGKGGGYAPSAGVYRPGTAGGSGGGGGGTGLPDGAGGAASPSGQGNAGGNGQASANGGGGGGGAGSVGTTATTGTNGTGGSGLSSSITGSAVTRAGGGGGYLGAAGGSGGGGAGGGSASNGVAGTVNTGGGGGGALANRTSGNGGSGVVILKYADTLTITIGAGLTGSTAAPSGGFKVTTITAGTGNVSWA